MSATGDDFVNQVLNANDVELAKLLLDDFIRIQRDSLPIDLRKPALVNQLLDCPSRRVPIRNQILNLTQHIDRSFVDPHKSRIVHLSQPQQPHYCSPVRVHLVHAFDPDHQRNLRLLRNEKRILSLCLLFRKDFNKEIKKRGRQLVSFWRSNHGRHPDIPFCIFELLRCIPALAFYFFHDALPSLFFAAPRILCLAFLSLSGFPEPAFSCFKSKSKNLGRQLPFFFFFFFFYSCSIF